MKQIIAITVIALFSCPFLHADSLDNVIDQLWKHCVKIYRSEKTGLFYGRPVSEIPPVSKFITVEQYKKGDYRTQPYKKGDELTVGYNLHGGGTGMEDCSLFTGTMLTAICDRFQATGQLENSTVMKRQAFKGICSVALAHGQRGFIARGVSPEDGKSIFAGSSRDQFTNAVFSIWRLYHSKLASQEDKTLIRTILVEIAEKMKREITPERNYSFDFAYGVPDDRGVAKMYDKEKKTLALRLAMFYAAAYSVTGDESYYTLFMNYLPDSITGMENWPEGTRQKPWSSPAYVVLQQGYAMRLVYEVTKDEAMKRRIIDVGNKIADFVLHWEKYDLTKQSPRDFGELVNGLLQMPCDWQITPEVEKLLRQKVVLIGPSGKGYPGSNYNIIGAWWKYRASK